MARYLTKSLTRLPLVLHLNWNPIILIQENSVPKSTCPIGNLTWHGPSSRGYNRKHQRQWQSNAIYLLAEKHRTNFLGLKDVNSIITCYFQLTNIGLVMAHSSWKFAVVVSGNSLEPESHTRHCLRQCWPIINRAVFSIACGQFHTKC